jgi:hypothetical protein
VITLFGLYMLLNLQLRNWENNKRISHEGFGRLYDGKKLSGRGDNIKSDLTV